MLWVQRQPPLWKSRWHPLHLLDVSLEEVKSQMCSDQSSFERRSYLRQLVVFRDGLEIQHYDAVTHTTSSLGSHLDSA